MTLEAELQGKTEAEKMTRERRAAPEAISSQAAEDIVTVPTATTKHVGRTQGRTFGVGQCRAAVGSIPVLAPLINVARHVVDA